MLCLWVVGEQKLGSFQILKLTLCCPLLDNSHITLDYYGRLFNIILTKYSCVFLKQLTGINHHYFIICNCVFSSCDLLKWF